RWTTHERDAAARAFPDSIGPFSVIAGSSLRVTDDGKLNLVRKCSNLCPAMAAAGDLGAGRGLCFPAAPALFAHATLPGGRSGLDTHAVAMGHPRSGRARGDANRSHGAGAAARCPDRRGCAFL